VRFAPPARRQEQIVRAQKLLDETDPAKSYPWGYVFYRMIDIRTTVQADLMVAGTELQHDLSLFVRRVERSLPPLPIEQAVEEVLTLEQISQKFGVSTKTIGRWRLRGLVPRRILINGRRQLGFARSMVEEFLQSNRDRVERGKHFSHLTDEEKQTILIRARRLANAGGSLTEISRRIARKLGRSVEAIRYTIRNFDQVHPESALFPKHSSPLSENARETIFDSYRRGIDVESLAKQYGRTRTSVYRVINEVHAQKLAAAPVDYIGNPEFDTVGIEADITGPMLGEDKFQAERRDMKPPRDVPAELASLYEWPLLSREQERHQFRLMNFLKHQLRALQTTLTPATAKAADLVRIETLHEQIDSVNDRPISCNMRLVANIAKKHSMQNPNSSLFDLISDGNISLMRAVEKFDYSLGNKFSTYATWAIIKNFARSIPDEKTHRERYQTGTEEFFDIRADNRSDEQELLMKAQQARDRVKMLLEGLDPRTREVIRMRNGLDGAQEMTLEQIGQHFGITKERVRQINVRGMKQLRELALAERVELP